jgi:hypothetical protein
MILVLVITNLFLYSLPQWNQVCSFALFIYLFIFLSLGGANDNEKNIDLPPVPKVDMTGVLFYSVLFCLFFFLIMFISFIYVC